MPGGICTRLKWPGTKAWVVAKQNGTGVKNSPLTHLHLFARTKSEINRIISVLAAGPGRATLLLFRGVKGVKFSRDQLAGL